ncbi:MAG: hypothetical protein JW740_01610 [Candidatus Zambryskibacteria bacterium]|nr:hypothetical protein [Candidatus Zambryskibacteria bacterium]
MKNKIISFLNSLFVNHYHYSFFKKLENLFVKMRYTEKIILSILVLIVAISGLNLFYCVNKAFLVEIPVFGGEFTEGLIGSPRFINPVLAISDTDKDLVSLIYSGLLKPSKNGDHELDLAESYKIGGGGTTYEFTLKNDIYFHDGKKITVDDIIFTIEKVMDPIIKSPKKTNWEGVLVEKIDDQNIKFTLEKPYIPFFQTLTLGVLPKHIWQDISAEEFPFSDYNIKPIGSGPYRVEKIVKNSGGIPTSITLNSWKKYSPERPKIKSIILEFFQNETELVEAFKKETVGSTVGFNPKTIRDLKISPELIKESSLPRVFGVFLNQNLSPVLLHQEIREALKISAPKQKILDEVLLGFGRILNGPTPINIEENTLKTAGDLEAAKTLLEKKGWKMNEESILEKETKEGKDVFSFSISTSDTPELKEVAQILKETWEKLGASITVKIFEASDLNQNVIRPRKYDALLFGEVVGEDSDLYPFWHSAERNDPGLNISLYANITVDKNLEDLQKEIEEQEKISKKEEIFAEIDNDIPAIFLFSPHMIYLKSPEVKNITMKNVSAPNERFIEINEWFIETDKVWKIFAPGN